MSSLYDYIIKQHRLRYVAEEKSLRRNEDKLCLRDRYLSLHRIILRERILFRGSLHTIAPIEPRSRHQNAVLGIQDRRIGDDFSARRPEWISSIKDHFGARKAVHPRFNSCPSCSVTFRQLHCQVRARAWVQAAAAAPTCGRQPHK